MDPLERPSPWWRGAALAEFATETWAAPEAARLDELRLAARERFVDARMRCGADGEAVIDAEALIRDRAAARGGLALLAPGQYATGRQGDALATLRRARACWPTSSVSIRGRALPSWNATCSPSRSSSPRRLPPRRRCDRAAVPPSPAPSDLVGRDPRARGRHRRRRAARPGPRRTAALALIAGDAGGGKSALLARLRDDLPRPRVAHGGGPVPGVARLAAGLGLDPGAARLAAHADPGPLRARSNRC